MTICTLIPVRNSDSRARHLHPLIDQGKHTQAHCGSMGESCSRSPSSSHLDAATAVRPRNMGLSGRGDQS
jgi:hypothetical protein